MVRPPKPTAHASLAIFSSRPDVHEAVHINTKQSTSIDSSFDTTRQTSELEQTTNLLSSPSPSKTSLNTGDTTSFITLKYSPSGKKGHMPLRNGTASGRSEIAFSPSASDEKPLSVEIIRSCRARKPTGKALDLAASGSRLYASLKTGQHPPEHVTVNETITENDIIEEAESDRVTKPSETPVSETRRRGRPRRSVRANIGDLTEANGDDVSLASTPTSHIDKANVRGRQKATKDAIDPPSTIVHEAELLNSGQTPNIIRNGTGGLDQSTIPDQDTEASPSGQSRKRRSVQECVSDTRYEASSQRPKRASAHPVEVERSTTDEPDDSVPTTQSSAKKTKRTRDEESYEPEAEMNTKSRSNPKPSKRRTAQAIDLEEETRVAESSGEREKLFRNANLTQMSSKIDHLAQSQAIDLQFKSTRLKQIKKAEILGLRANEPPACNLHCLDPSEIFMAFAEVAIEIDDQGDDKEGDIITRNELNKRLQVFCRCAEKATTTAAVLKLNSPKAKQDMGHSIGKGRRRKKKNASTE